MDTIHPNLMDLSESDQEMVQSCLVEFEGSWDEGQLAERIARLPPHGNLLRRHLLVGLVTIDLTQQWLKGRSPSVEDYLQAYPELGTPATVSQELIEAEFKARKQTG